MVHRQLTANFLNPSLEWRRVFGEIWGTFLLVLVAAGGGGVGAISNGRVTLSMMAVTAGIMVMAIIYFMGPVSEAHFCLRTTRFPEDIQVGHRHPEEGHRPD